MGKFNMILCGSRALDYFIEGSATSESDWNFYCDSTKISIYGSLKALEKAGVVWYELAKAGTIAASQFKNKLPSTSIPHYVERLISYVNISENKWKNMKYENAYEVLTDLRNYESYETYGISKIIGHIDKDNHRYGVELKFSTRDKTSMELLMDFQLSALQCFIGAYGAGHLYYNTVVDKISYYWIDSRYDGLDPIIFKYRNKGFKLIKYHNKEEIKVELNGSLAYSILTEEYSNASMISTYNNVSSIRFLSDSKSKFISFGKYYNTDRINKLMDDDGCLIGTTPNISNYTVLDTLSEIKLGMLWYQLPWKPVLVPSIMEGMCTQLHIEKYKYEVISSYMLQIAENSVFMDACIAKKTKFLLVDSIYDKSLLRHIRDTLRFYGAIEK